MRRIYLNVFCALLVFATASSIRAEEYKPGKIMKDYQLQLATFSILNTDTPVELGIPTHHDVQPQPLQDEAPVKMVPVSTLNSHDKAQSEPKTKPQNDPPGAKRISKSDSDTKTSDVKAASKTANSLNLIKPEKVERQTPAVKDSIAENSPK